FIPLFNSRNGTFGRSIFAASVVLAIMVLPIIAAICREVFRQVPQANREAALALGATRWEMIRVAVLPPSRSGVVGAVMLGLGRPRLSRAQLGLIGVASIGLTGAAFAVTPAQGLLDFLLVAYLVFVAAQTAASAAVEGLRAAKNRLALTLLVSAVVMALIPLV